MDEAQVISDWERIQAKATQAGVRVWIGSTSTGQPCLMVSTVKVSSLTEARGVLKGVELARSAEAATND